ncbi:isoprenoid synthase domain-containing protein [Suillus ampliporus]|nr:isoprenoid synthase domain-containing protein [Suillus ampliporus]
MDPAATPESAVFILFDFSNCHYPLRLNPHYYQVFRASDQWIFRNMGLRAGYFAVACHSDADAFDLKACSDFLNLAFKLDYWLEIDRLFSRFRETGGPACTEQFIHRMDLLSVFAGRTNDVKSYIDLRRDLTGLKACFAVIESAAWIDLPNEVVSHLAIVAMEEATNDFVACTHNLVVVLMSKQGLDLKGAVDYCGQLCKSVIQRFEENRAILPSWGEEVDKQVAIYVQGLQDWISGSLHWSFESMHTVRRDRIAKLHPKKPLYSIPLTIGCSR